MQILPLADPQCCCIRSTAFNTDLEVAGLSADELGGLFRAEGSRPDWPAIAARGPIRIHCDKDRPSATESILQKAEPMHLAGGHARLASGSPGEAHLDGNAQTDDRLLPGPLNLLLAQQWARQGLFPLHAAALCWQDRGLLVLGDQGSGKSSLILAALEQGARIVSDDWMLIGIRDGAARAERLREFLMFRPGASWDRFGPALSRRQKLVATTDGRFVHAIADDAESFPSSTRLDRCVVLQVPGSSRPRTTTLAETEQARVLAQLIEGAMPILMTRRFPLERDQLFDRFHALVSGLPTLTATTGLDLMTRPRQVLDRLVSG